MLHQVCVSFDLYYDARKHKIKIQLIRRCDDLPPTITHVPVAAVLVLNTPDDGRLRPKHVEQSVPALIRCDDLPPTITHVPVAAVLVLSTPDDGRLRPKHVE